MIVPVEGQPSAERIVVVSPHFDDGVLSLGASIASWCRAGATVLLLTVFGCDPDSTAPSGGWDRRGGFRTEGESARARRGGGPPGMRGAGRDVRARPRSGASITSATGRTVTSEPLCAPAVEGASLVLLPGFPLSHPDHDWLVRTLVSDFKSDTRLSSGPIGLYGEQPYTRRAGTRPHVHAWLAELVGPAVFERIPVRPRDRVAKWRAIRSYHSQPFCSECKGVSGEARTATPSVANGSPGYRTNLHGGMKLVMSLLVRDEADIVDAQIAYHLHAGVDFVVATDNRSEDATPEILERYAHEGVLHLIREPGDDLRQSEWVTRMARLAGDRLGADWIINADADEFWLAARSLKELLCAVPTRFGVVRGAWRNFVPRPDDGACSPNA